MIQILRNGAPAEVILFETPGHLMGGLWTYSAYINDIWRLSSRLTLTPGLRYDRYREFLPEQVHPVGPFNPTEDAFPAVDNVITWNLFAPRLGVTYDLLGNGRTVLKFNYARYYWNPSVLSDNNPNAAPWYRRYNWSDPNRSGVWEPGEEGTLTRTVGGSAAQSIDPNLKDTHTDELATWFERELIANFGIRTGFVYRAIRDRYSSYNAAQPFASFNVPVQIPDPGPDGVTGTSDDGPSIAGFNLDPTLVGVASRNVLANAPAKNDYYTWEVPANRRMAVRWQFIEIEIPKYLNPMKDFFKFMLASMLGFIIISVILFFIFIGLVASLASFADKKSVTLEPNTLLVMKLDYQIFDRAPKDPFSMFSPEGFSMTENPGLDQILKNIRKAETDPNVKVFTSTSQWYRPVFLL